MPLPRRIAAALAVVALLAAACTQQTTGTGSRISASSSAPTSGSPSSSATTPPAPTPSPIQFKDCTAALAAVGMHVPPELQGKLQVGCGKLDVPLDYTHPDNGTISLIVVRFHDTDNTASPAQPLLVNPGGPGSSGIEFTAGFLSQLPVSVLQHYDLIGFDPRGVELSTPVHCLTNKQKDAFWSAAPDPTTPSGFAVAQQLDKSVDEGCQESVGSSLPYFNTVNTARDVDQIRQALGAPDTNYFGFSYGTELGWVYAHLFPDKVRAFVLDGAIDPDLTPIQQFAGQVQGFENAFDQFEQYCKTVSPCDELADPRQTALQIAAAARTEPLSTGSDRKLTVGLVFLGILSALYSEQTWPQLASGLVNGAHGDGSDLLALADRYTERQPDGSYPNLMDANTVISCNDSPPGPTDAQAHQIAAQWARKFPLFGRWQAGQLFSCQDWQPDRTLVPKAQAATQTKVLVVGNLHDPATPYRGAQDLARDLGNAELLSWDGEGHTSYLSSTCIQGYVNHYLTTLAMPPAGTTCPA